MGGVVGDIESLKNEILKQAREQAVATRERAIRVAERDLFYAGEEAEGIVAQQKAKVAPVLEVEKRKSIAVAEMEARRRLLEKKEELVEMIFSEAQSRLEEMRGSEAYKDMIFKLIDDGVASINGDVIVEFGEKDKGIFTSDFVSFVQSRMIKSLGNFRLQFQCIGDGISAGVIIKSKDGKMIVDNSFSGRIKRLKEELRGKVSEMLLQEE